MLLQENTPYSVNLTVSLANGSFGFGDYIQLGQAGAPQNGTFAWVSGPGTQSFYTTPYAPGEYYFNPVTVYSFASNSGPNPGIFTVNFSVYQVAIPTNQASTNFQLIVPPPCSKTNPGTNQMVGCLFNDGTGPHFTVNYGNAPDQTAVSSPADTAMVVNQSPPYGSGVPQISTNYSTRYQGKFNFSGGTYTFTIYGEDGFALYVDGSAIYTNWNYQPASNRVVTANLTPGQHIIKLEHFDGGGYQPQKLSWVLTTPLPPTISLNPTSFSFAGTVGGFTPSTQNLVVGNSGGSTLNWTATTGQSWCHVSPSSGSVAAGNSGSNVTVSVDAPAAALVGTNNCNISVSATGASNTPQFASVQYLVQAGNPGTGSSHLACQGSGSSAACVWVSGAGANSCATDADCGNSGGGGGGSPVNADNAVCSKIILTWQSGAGATGYNIYRANHPGAPGAVLATVGAVNSYTDNGTVVGTKYDYWVESISGSLGGTGNKIPSNTNPTGIASVSCGSPPAAPTNPAWDNHATNAAVACNTIKFSWTDNSTNEDGFKIYKGPSGSAFPGSGSIATINSTSVAGTGQTYTYTYSIGSDTAPYQYWVIAYNTYGNSSSVAFNGGSTIVNVACVAQLGSSDKLITAVNNVPISGVSSCNGVNGASAPLPSYLTPKASDVFSFSVNICNSGSVDATSLKITDSLTSLQMPAGGFGAKYDGNNLSYVGACSGTSFPASSGNYCAYGTAPNQTLLFNLTNYTVPAGTSRALTFNAQLPPSSSITISNPRFQNSAHIDFAGSATGVNVYTPLQMFSVGNRVPVIEEKP
ncbi:MAG: hypothetical protein KGJ93_05165 [Patescibacteria group bacterium]|nr:hypothetical protein [Patescibacteria group bacterium]